MKNRSLTLFGLSLTALAIGQSALAQVQRHPTPEEAETQIQTETVQMIPQLQQQSPIYSDRRGPSQNQDVQSFQAAWAQISPNTAPFLGEWHGSSMERDFFVAIYPSNNSAGRVCVVKYTPSNNRYLFGFGSLTNEQINVTGDDFVTTYRRVSGEEFLAEIYVDRRTNQPRATQPTAFPVPLRTPDSYLAQRPEQRLIDQGFRTTGCTADLPAPRESGALRNLSLTNSQTLNDITFQFDGAYISQGNSVEAYWVIENGSNRSFSFFPVNVRVVNAAGEAIPGTRLYIDGDAATVDPGDRLTGRIVISRSPADLPNLSLVLPESGAAGTRLFEVPIR
jgi:hypothetical protein